MGLFYAELASHLGRLLKADLAAREIIFAELFAKGRQARLAGKPVTACPYDPNVNSAHFDVLAQWMAWPAGVWAGARSAFAAMVLGTSAERFKPGSALSRVSVGFVTLSVRPR
jgi:hypothetical protein